MKHENQEMPIIPKYPLLGPITLVLMLSSCSLFNPEDTTMPDVTIVYSFRHNEAGRYDRDIMLTNGDGSRDRVLFGETSNDFDPKFNNNRDGIFFLADKDGGRELFFADTNGTERVQLTTGRYIDSYDVSPVGDQVVFVDANSLYASVYVISLEDTEPEYVCVGWDPVFVDQGSALIMLVYSPTRNLRKVTLGSSDTLDITTTAANSQILAVAAERERFIVWSKPDNLTNFGYYLLSNDGEFLATLTFGAGITGHPSLSPNGEKFGYCGYSLATKGVEVYLDQIGAARPVQLTKQGLNASKPIFFDDDNFLLYGQNETSGYALYHVSAGGDNETRVSGYYNHPIEYYDVAVH